MSAKLTRRGLCRLAGTAGATWMPGNAAGCRNKAATGDFAAGQPDKQIIFSSPEGPVPLIGVEGTAYECGHRYGELVLERYPGYRRYLDPAGAWRSPSAEVKRLFEQRAPYVLEIYRGLNDAVNPPTLKHAAGSSVAPVGDECTSFGVSGAITRDGKPISGQTKDTVVDSAMLYIVLRMRIKGGPTMLVLAYPGEVLGYGLWSTGMSIFRNTLYSRGGDGHGLSMEQWGLLALAGGSTEEASELALEHGISTIGNFLISDAAGRSVSVESNAGGMGIIPARDGIAVHANHPVGSKTSPFEHFDNAVAKDCSRFRQEHLEKLLNAERGRLTAAKAMMCLADHSGYPHSLCRHMSPNYARGCTTAAVVAEPARGLLHVTRGNPCANWPASFSL